MKQREEQDLDKRIQRGKKELLKQIRKAKKRSHQTQKRWHDHMLRSNEKIVKKIASFEHEIQLIKSHISDFESRLGLELIRLESREEEFHSLKEVLKNTKKSFIDHKKELKKLMKLPHILAVEIVNNALRVYTDTLYIIQDSKKYEIGAFEITLNLDGFEDIDCLYDDIAFKNVTNTSSIERDHPYIYDQTYFCFGDLELDIEIALRQQDYVLALIYILQALQNGKGDQSDLVKEWKEVSYGA